MSAVDLLGTFSQWKINLVHIPPLFLINLREREYLHVVEEQTIK